MINRSFYLLRTNPLLTTNLKLTVTSEYKLYMESFNSNSELNNIKYKHFPISKNEYLENKIPEFYKKLPIDIAFDVKYDNDNKAVMNNFENQFDTIYYTGANYIQDQWYTEEFEYLAPLYIRKNNLPKGFIILRVDEPSDYNLNNDNDFELSNLNNTNFYTEIVNNWKCVKFFDMTYSSDLGKWLYLNYVNNDRYPKTAFEYHPERTEFSNWYGMDYTTGIYTYKPLFMEDRNEIETPHFRFEKYITEGYKRSNLIFPFILNLNFLFDDTPATPTKLKKYSMNRYYGFYVDDLEFVGSLTSYVTPEMIPGTYLVNNIIVTGDTGYTFDPCNLNNTYYTPTVNPFKEVWDDNKDYYVFIDNTNDFNRDKTVSGLYPVKKTIQDGLITYKVVSDEIMDGYWNTGYTNIKTVNITYGNFNIVSGISSDFFIDKYIDCNGDEKYIYGDLYLININGDYHVIKYSSGITFNELNIDNMNDLIVNPVTGDIDDYKYYIQSDYAINLDSKKLEYWILGKNSQYYKTLDVESPGRTPLTFPIYRLKFTDVKDFDFDRVNTDYSNFDYEKTAYVSTDEEKLYAFNYNDESIPPSKKVEREGTTSQYRISNVSSEYIAADELYEIYDLGQQLTTSNNTGENRLYDLTDIWRKNQSVCKWGFAGSISHSDYPYKLNNNYEAGGVFNRTVDPFTTIPNTNNKNMDYFYRIGNFYDSVVSNPVYYKNQTTNIQSDFIKENLLGSGFDLKVYFQDNSQYDINFDYFTYFFKNKELFEDDNFMYIRSYDKYSVFVFGDDNVNSVTLFKGLKIKIKEIKNIYSSGNRINEIFFGNKNYNDYKFSIILNENYDGIDSGLLNNDGYIDTLRNGINIILNEKYKNVLVIINLKLSGMTTTFNDISVFDEKGGIYYGKKKDGSVVSGYDPILFNSTNFINAINNYNEDYGLYVRYYYIKEIDGVSKYGQTLATNFSSESTGMKNIWSYDYQPFLLKIETPVSIILNNNCYSTVPFYVNGVDDDYVGTMLQFDSSKSSKTVIYRFPGPYEPIFKDVSLFKSGYFCYNNINTGSTTYTGGTYSVSTTTNQSPSSISSSTSWENIGNLCSVINSNYVSINCPNTGSVPFIESKQLFVYDFDFTVVPNNAIITGITLEITRKSNTICNNDLYVRDKQSGVWPNCGIQLAKNVFDNTTYSSDRAPISGDNYWSNELTTISYPLNGLLNDTWDFTTLTGGDVKSKYFGVLIAVQMKNILTSNSILPQIKCVKLTLRYEYEKSFYTTDRVVYFDNNLKFDTELNDFGKIDELVFSKINDKIDILNDLVNKYRIYPVIDEYGYDYSSRFVFKSSWDKEFFTKTEITYSPQTGNI